MHGILVRQLWHKSVILQKNYNYNKPLCIFTSHINGHYTGLHSCSKLELVVLIIQLQITITTMCIIGYTDTQYIYNIYIIYEQLSGDSSLAQTQSKVLEKEATEGALFPASWSSFPSLRRNAFPHFLWSETLFIQSMTLSNH